MSLNKDDSGLSKLGLLAIGGMFALAIHKNNKRREETERIEAQERRRKNTKCKFEDGIAENQFAEIALKAAKRIKRVKNVYVSGTVIDGEVESQSGISTWCFSIDFNDHGHITGRYWVDSENDDSNIPNHIAEVVSKELIPFLHSPSANNLDDVSYDLTDNASAKKTKHTFLKNIKENRADLIILAIICVIGLYTFFVRQQTKLIPVGMDSASFCNLDCDDVYDMLSDHGFSNISIDEVSDLAYVNREKVGQVINITIDGENSFVSGDEFPHNANIIIRYHELKPVYPPISNKEAKGKDYTGIQTSFVDAGFANIKLEPTQSIGAGWLIKKGAVDSIIIDGKSKYDEKEQYQPDVEVIIKYYVSLSDK